MTTLAQRDLAELLGNRWRINPAGYVSHLSQFKGQPVPAHIRLVSDRIARAVSGLGNPRLIISMPPRHGKSFSVSHWTPVWFLDHWPTHRVILASYEADFAASWGRKVRDTISENRDSLRVRISDASSAAHEWDTTEGGGMSTAGIGGPITGKGANLLLIDDPVKNAEEANSQVIRDKQWDWLLTTAFTRREPGAVTVVMMTRWHEDDLIGRLLRTQREEGGDEWDVISLPALANLGDPLGRQPGAALWPERYDVTALESIRSNLIASDGRPAWEALYQQAPTDAQGLKFRREWIRRYDALPPGLTRLMAVDFAGSTKAQADRTAIAVIAVKDRTELYLVDMLYGRWDAGEGVRTLQSAVLQYAPKTIDVETMQHQSIMVQQLREATNWPIREAIPDKAKHLRADPVAAAFERGEIYLPRLAPWLEEFERELLAFPQGRHDDMVDALVYAWRRAQLYQPQNGHQAGGSVSSYVSLAGRRQ